MIIKYINEFYGFVVELVERRQLIAELTKRDFKIKYLGSYLGICWAFIHPAVYITLLWFVFQFALKEQPALNHPFVLWLLAGAVPWFFFSDCLSNATSSIVEYGFLLKKMSFSVGMLPIVKILSSLIIHSFFILVVFFMSLAYGYSPSFHTLQILYYLFAASCLLLGLSWLTSSIVVFFRDLGQIILMVLQFGFWVTPIFWSPERLPAKYILVLKLNPVFYLVQGYRDSLLGKNWFWQEYGFLTLYYWLVTGCVFICGAAVFRRLRPYFGDVL